MSQKTIQMRAAEIRRSWSRNERKTRAAMGERRCLALLFQAGLVRPCLLTLAGFFCFYDYFASHLACVLLYSSVASRISSLRRY
jgi:hypothetical protein